MSNRSRNSGTAPQPIAGGRRIIAAIESQAGQREARPIDLTCDNCHSEGNFTAIPGQIFLQMWQLPPRQIERCFTILLMLKKGLGQELRRISHGPAIRHHHPLRFGLQLGRHRPELGHNVDRRCAFLCAADGRLSFFLRTSRFWCRGMTDSCRCIRNWSSQLRRLKPKA